MSTLNFCAIPQLRKHIVSYTKFIVNTFTHTLIMLLKGYSLQYIHLHIHYAKETPYYTIIHSHIHYSILRILPTILNTLCRSSDLLHMVR